MKPLPRKISPDPIRDAIVEIRYESKLPSEVLVGLLFSALDDTYTYADQRPPRKNNLPATSIIGMPQEISFEFRPRSLFYNEEVVIQMLPGSLAFNCREAYIGWEAFTAQITVVMQRFETIGQILRYTRVGIRYINDFPGTDPAENTCFTFGFGLPDVQSHAYQFRAEFLQDNDKKRVILQLGKRELEGLQIAGNTAIISSVMDIDVIKDNLQLSAFEEVIKELNAVHTKEKEVFYSVLKPEFLTMLHPEY